MVEITKLLTKLIGYQDLSHDEMIILMRNIMQGGISETQLSAILIALRMKNESIIEITAAAEVMREYSLKVAVEDNNSIVDIVGTGGDGARTFNISTTAMFVAAAAGIKVAKHGGRSVSSSSGSADILEKLKVPLNSSAQKVSDSIRAIGIGFIYAPNHHSSMNYVAPIRKALGIRTIFNILGPLTNPASAKNQLLGVFNKELVKKMASVLDNLGAHHALVVHGSDGLDEITITGATHVAELNDGIISEYDIYPEQFGIHQYDDLNDIKVNDSKESLGIMLEVLNGKDGAAKDIVVLNAGAAIYAGNAVSSLEEGVQMARVLIDTGKALNKLKEFINFSNS